jgi:cardiolipin synthase
MGPKANAKRWQDLGSRIEGPSAALLNEIFIEDWCFATKQSSNELRAELPLDATKAVGACELQVVASGPDVPGDPLYEGIVSMIQEAEKSIIIVTPYFIPDEVLLRSLIVKARAGREVTLIVPFRSNHPVTDYARRYYTRELRAAGGNVKHFLPRMLHAKAVIVDDKVALYGSPNFDLRSLFVNFEVGIFVHSTTEVAKLRAWADGLLQHCRDPLVERPGQRRIFSSLVEELARLLAPLL